MRWALYRSPHAAIETINHRHDPQTCKERISVQPDPVLLSRIQWAWVIGWHILLPAFTVGLASYIAVLEGLYLFTKRAIWLRISRFWTRIFSVAFAIGVATGIAMPFQFGTNWAPVFGRGCQCRIPDALSRGSDGLLSGGELSWRTAFRPQAGAALGVFLVRMHGCNRHAVLIILDSLAQ